jgi:hypothetical protein
MRKMGLLLALVCVGTALVLTAGPSVSKNNVAKAFDPTAAPEIQDRLLSGFATLELGSPSTGTQGGPPSTFSPRGNDQCPSNIGSNIKVNQNCLNLSDPSLAGRGQSQNETSLAIDKNDTNNIVASQNDYRRGDGNCYSDYSTDGGRTWEDSTDPMSFSVGGAPNFPLGAREYWEAGGDTSVAFDTKGNAYLSCQVFNRGRGATNSADLSSAFLIFRSSNHGASWNFPGRYVRASGDVTGSGNAAFLDKQLMTVDDHAGSPFQDRVYVTWTEFATDGSAFIYEAYSSDYGEHFSAPHLVSTDSPLCVNTYGAGTTSIAGEHSNCNENQFSQPFTGSDGALYVVWNNFNNAETLGGADNRNQILLAKSTDGGNTFSAPVKVGDYYDLPDCATYQGGKDFGRACVPEKNATANSVFRATNYASGEVDPTNPAHVVVTYGSYINKHSNESNGCVPAGINPATGQDLYTGVKTAGACNNDILVSSSSNGGSTFTGTATDPRTMAVATTDPGQATSDQFWQWISFTKSGKLATSYYDRQYGTDEATGFSDFSLSGSGDGTSWNVQRVTSSPMPPPTQFSGTFYGDYTGLDAWTNANPIWSDTRNPELFTGAVCGGAVYATCTGTYSDTGLVANDEDIYTANLPVPSK